MPGINAALRHRRYTLFPLHRAYDARREVYHPQLIYNARPSFSSAIINIDRHGFRRSHYRQHTVDSESWFAFERKGVVLGGSFVFGVGASSDAETMVSCLSGLKRMPLLNLGMRAANSTQELVAALPFVPLADEVIVCSGINNVTVALQSIGTNEMFGPFYMEHILEPIKQFTPGQLARRLARPPLGVQLSRLFQWLRKPIRTGPAASTSCGQPNFASIIDAAVARQVRDFSVIAAYCRSRRTPPAVTFALQPYAALCTRQPSPEEIELFAIADALQPPEWQQTLSEIARGMQRMRLEIQRVCHDLGAGFVDLSEAKFDGWSFIDRVHMNSHGLALAATHLATT